MRRIAYLFRYVRNVLTGRHKVVMMEILLKSGNSFCVDVESAEWKTRASQVSELTWKTPPFPTSKLSTVNVDQIEAILIHA